MALPSHRIQAPGRVRRLDLKFTRSIWMFGIGLVSASSSVIGQSDIGDEILIELPEQAILPEPDPAPPEPVPQPLPIEQPEPAAEKSSITGEPDDDKDRPPAASDPVAIKIVDNYINALGGSEAIGQTKNLVIRTAEVSGQQEYETLIFRTAAGKARVERVGFHKGRPSEFHWVSDGEQFWSVNYYRNKELVQWFSDNEMFSFLFKQRLYPHLYQHHEQGVKLRYLGIETQKRVEYYLVKAYFPNGVRIEYLFDKTRFLPHQYRFRNRHNGDEGYRIITPTRYKRINGALWETDSLIHFGELPLGSFTVDRIEGNQRLPESMFYAPERKELVGALPDRR